MCGIVGYVGESQAAPILLVVGATGGKRRDWRSWSTEDMTLPVLQFMTERKSI